MSDYYTPTSVANEAIDAAGLRFTLGDIEEGVHPSQVLLRHYWTCLNQLLRAAPWNFARKQADLLLLADSTGQTTGVGTLVPRPWVYAYAMPTDCVRMRYIPWNPFNQPAVPAGNIVPPDSGSPLMTNLDQNANAGARLVPARYLVTTDINNIPAGAGNDAQGISPIGRTIICTNVRYAIGIYTFQAIYPNLWDAQFRAAMVAFLASVIAVPLHDDKKFGMQMRDRNIAIAHTVVKNARVSDGLEGWHSSDLSVDWMRFRNSGGYGGWASWWSNVGDLTCTWDNIGFGGGSTGNSSAF